MYRQTASSMYISTVSQLATDQCECSLFPFGSLEWIMAAVSLAIIGKNKKPIYIREFVARESAEVAPDEELFGLSPVSETLESSQTTCSLRQQFILHAALDRFEQLEGPPPGFGWRKGAGYQSLTGTDAMWVGLLCPVEDLRVYGYMTTTHIKFLLAVEDASAAPDQATVDQNIKRLLSKLHRAYVDYTLNPFTPVNAPTIESERFNNKIESCVELFNRAAIV